MYINKRSARPNPVPKLLDYAYLKDRLLARALQSAKAQERGQPRLKLYGVLLSIMDISQQLDLVRVYHHPVIS